MKNFSLEAMTIQLEALQKRMIESEEQRERQSYSRNYQTIVFPKKEERKAEEAQNAETSEASKADDPEDAKKAMSGAVG